MKNSSDIPSFLCVFCYVFLFVLLALLVWICVELGNAFSWTVAGFTWVCVFLTGGLLRLLSVRKCIGSALKTAWWIFVLMFVLLLGLDTGICGMTQCPICELLADNAISSVSYSFLLLSLPLSALCFPWGNPMLYIWVRLLPWVFEVIGMSYPGVFSITGRLALMAPLLLMIPLGYWVWFSLLPNAWHELITACRVEIFKSKSSAWLRTIVLSSGRILNSMRIWSEKLQTVFRNVYEAVGRGIDAIRKRQQGNNDVSDKIKTAKSAKDARIRSAKLTDAAKLRR